MMEPEWLASADVRTLCRSVWQFGLESERKFCLHACACCQRAKILASHPRSRQALEVIERYVDGLATEAERSIALTAAEEETPFRAARLEQELDTNPGQPTEETPQLLPPPTAAAQYLAEGLCLPPAALHAVAAACRGGAFADLAAMLGADAIGHSVGAFLFRDIFGNPFRPVTVEPAWLTSTVVSLATAIYGDRAFDRLPILADALDDAGCAHTDILNHCRQPGEHVRGCWAVDLVLRKS